MIPPKNDDVIYEQPLTNRSMGFKRDVSWKRLTLLAQLEIDFRTLILILVIVMVKYCGCTQPRKGKVPDGEETGEKNSSPKKDYLVLSTLTYFLFSLYVPRQGAAVLNESSNSSNS